jgi:hypothetical protein
MFRAYSPAIHKTYRCFRSLCNFLRNAYERSKKSLSLLGFSLASGVLHKWTQQLALSPLDSDFGFDASLSRHAPNFGGISK